MAQQQPTKTDDMINSVAFMLLLFFFYGQCGYLGHEARLEIVPECNISIISRSTMVCTRKA